MENLPPLFRGNNGRQESKWLPSSVQESTQPQRKVTLQQAERKKGPACTRELRHGMWASLEKITMLGVDS